MNEEFGQRYVQSYDTLYREKDYVGECDLIERIIRSHGRGGAASILDLGCGTGNHAIPLARRGYEVVGVDRSPWMLAEARRKVAIGGQHANLTLIQGDLRSLDLQRRFDVVLMMFAVLGYQLEDADVRAAFDTARRHLPEGGLLLFDVWFGPAVLHQEPTTRVKTVPIPGGHARRSATPALDVQRQVCAVHFRVQRVADSGQTVETEETHRMRYFFRDELDRFLAASHLLLVRLGAFPAFDEEPGEDTWNVLAVARAV